MARAGRAPSGAPMPVAPVRCQPPCALSSSGPASTDGTWPSLVGHLTGGQGVAGSNPAVPTVFRTLVALTGNQVGTIKAGCPRTGDSQSVKDGDRKCGLRGP